MKRNYLLAVLLLFITSTLCAQPKSTLDSLKQQYEKYPQQALREAEKIRTEALRTNDKALFLEALFLKIHFTLQIDSDQYPAVIEEVKKCIADEQELSARSILHTCLSQLYQEYYNRNRHKIAQRAALEGDLPESIEEWSPNLFEQHIFEELTASIAPAEALQATPISRYRTIYAISPATDTLRPTLYDHLCHKAIEMIPSPFRKVPDTIAMLPALLGNAEAFLGIVLPESGAPGHLRIWQQLLRFRSTAGNAAAFVLADLERLDNTHHIYNGEDGDTLYLNTLEEMRKAYVHLPISVEIIAREAEWLSRHLHDGNALANNKRALALCEEGIRKFPKYPRINRLHTIISHIKQPGITVRFPQTIYPGEAFDLHVNSRNLTGFTLDIYRINATIEAFQAIPYADRQQLSRTLVRQKSYQLPSSLIPQDTTVNVQGLPAGFYWLKFSAPHTQDSVGEYVVCTALFAYQRTSDKENLIRVCDLNSGKPVKGATVRIYNRKYPTCQLLDSALTNAQGFARLPLKGNFYQVTDSRNPAGELQHFYKSDNSSLKKEAFLEIITDRQIYRPGQTVYYKGIAWKAGTDTIFTRTDTPFSVSFYGANHELLDKQTKRSNAFGSFTGSFTLPAQTMNGSFRIEADGNVFFVQVAEYKRPEFEITFIPQEKSYHPTDTIRVKGKIMTFSGIRLDNVPIRYEIEKTEFWTRRGSSTSVKGITTTNATGEFEWSFPADLIPPDKRSSTFYAYDITVQATDPKGETQSARTQVIVHAGEITPQLEVPEQVDKQARTAFVISLKNAYSDNAPQTVGYTIARLAAPSKLSYPVAFTDTTVLETILQKEITVTGSETIFPMLTDQPSGAYLWSVTCNGKTSKQIFYLYSPEDRKPPIPTYNWTVAEKTRCRPGEKARILFGTSVSDANVLYEVFAPGRLVKREFFTLSDEIKALEIPYLAEYGSRIWVSLIYVKHKNIIRENIPIDRIYDNRRLTVETGTFRDKLVPGQEEEWTLRILDESGKPVKAEVLAMMYDASLDQLYRNPIDFAPNHLLMSPHQIWEGYYWPQSLGYASPYFKSKYYPVPDFYFIQRGYFEKRRAMDYGFADFDAADSGILHETATTAKQVQASGNALTKSFNAAPRYAIKAEAATEEASNSGGGTPLNYRQNFAETAFFYPQILSDSAGQASFRFKVPESNTRWHLIALATTPSIATGKLETYVTTSKPLTVRPNLPRFFRSGDHTILKITVSNLSDSLQQGTAGVELFLPGNQKILLKQTANFQINGKENKTLDFALKIPEDIDLAGCRIFAGNKTFNDGEQHLLPVLPNEVLLTETQPIYATQAGPHTYTLSPSSSPRKNYRLTLELSANPTWYAVLALPALSEPQQENATDISASFYVNTIAHKITRLYPVTVAAIRQWKNTPGTPTLLSQLEQNAELKSILLNATPWMLEAENETEQMQRLAELFDENRLHYLQEKTLNQLKKLQNSDGGWSWFKGMYSSQFMTANVLTILARSTTVGEFQPDAAVKQMQIKALRYLDKEITNDFKNKNNHIHYNQLLYLYTRSFYRDIPLGDALEAHKYYMEQIQKQWSGFSLYEKAIATVALNNYGFRNESRKILESLRQYAVTTPEDGMYWPNNRNQYYRNSTVQVHTAIMEAFILTEGHTAEINLMNQWLLRQKQVQNWINVPSTVDAIYTLLLTGNGLLTAKEQLNVRIGKHKLSVSAENNPIGYLKKSYSPDEIRPDMLTVKMDKQIDTPSWGSLYLQYFEKLDRVKKQKTEISVDKKLYIEQANSQGKAELLSLDKHPLKVGDKVIVRLTVTLNRDMEFLHLKDLRAACFEPAETLSGNRWKFGTVYYQETKDAVTNFFFNALGRGTYVLEYPVWVNQAGSYQDGMATFQSIYAPEYNAHSTTRQIQVKP